MNTFIDFIIAAMMALALLVMGTLLFNTMQDPLVEAPTTQEFTGEIVYKGAHYERYEEVYYIIVEGEDMEEGVPGAKLTFKTPPYLWMQLKLGADWTYVPHK